MRQLKFKITKGNEEYPYNIQQWTSVDGGKSYAYCGICRYCRTTEEINRFIGGQLDKAVQL